MTTERFRECLTDTLKGIIEDWQNGEIYTGNKFPIAMGYYLSVDGDTDPYGDETLLTDEEGRSLEIRLVSASDDGWMDYTIETYYPTKDIDKFIEETTQNIIDILESDCE